MRPEEHLTRFVNFAFSFMHKRRLESLESVLSSCLRQERLAVTSLGRGINRDVFEKHRIKQADRLLSNGNFLAELPDIYASLASLVIARTKWVVILVDWSNLDSNQRHFLLRAAVAVKGRSLTIYEEVHTNQTKERRKTHKEFLRRLKETLPDGVVPIIVTDAGFRVTWFREVESLGWEWVGRIRGRMKVELDGENTWIDGRLLHPQAGAKPINFDDAKISKHNTLDARLVLYKAKPKGRVMLNKFGKRRTWIAATRAEKAGREPWLLATSLNSSAFTARDIVKIYSARMQIEESFRDAKCTEYGIGLNGSRTYKTNRLAALVAIATVANLFSWILGQAVKTAGHHRSFQANSFTRYDVLSNTFIGLRFFKQTLLSLKQSEFIAALKAIPTMANQLCIT